MARHAARRVALQMIFARMLGGEDCESVLEEQPDILQVLDDQAFIDEALTDIQTRIEEFDSLIQTLSPERALDRIPKLDRAILYLALHELSQKDDSESIVINEAVELAKRFGRNQTADLSTASWAVWCANISYESCPWDRYQLLHIVLRIDWY